MNMPLNMIPALVPPFGCRVLEDGLLYLLFLLALAGFAAACFFAVNCFLHSLPDHDSSSQKHKPFSKGASR
jgi:hypothetical protein